MPSIFMRFWYTSFHLLQYLLYQEIGGGRMTDQTDIASLAFQWQPPTPTPTFSFLIPLHPSFLSSSYLLLSNWNLNGFGCVFDSFLTPSYLHFFFLCISTSLGKGTCCIQFKSILVKKMQHYFRRISNTLFQCMFTTIWSVMEISSS